MNGDWIYDRGPGPELKDTRITIYTVLVDFLNPIRTEAEVAAAYQLPPEQVAAARAYILRNYDAVMEVHHRIEERHRRGREAQDTPEFLAKVEAARENFGRFKEWVAERKALGLPPPRELGEWGPAFREWLASREHAQAGAS